MKPRCQAKPITGTNGFVPETCEAEATYRGLHGHALCWVHAKAERNHERRMRLEYAGKPCSSSTQD